MEGSNQCDPETELRERDLYSIPLDYFFIWLRDVQLPAVLMGILKKPDPRNPMTPMTPMTINYEEPKRTLKEHVIG